MRRPSAFWRASSVTAPSTARSASSASARRTSSFDLDPAALDDALRDREEPAIVLMQAGDINTGAFDDFATLIPIAKRHGAWVHVDGAFGLWAAASPKYAHLLEGAEAADSWVTDGHKWLNVPFDCAYAFVANRDAHYGSMSHRAAYLTHDAVARDAGDWTPEWSRRARSFPTYAALRFLGRNGLADLIERCCRHAYDLVTRIGRLPGAEVLAVPVINQGLLRFGDRTRRSPAAAATVRPSTCSRTDAPLTRCEAVMR